MCVPKDRSHDVEFAWVVIDGLGDLTRIGVKVWIVFCTDRINIEFCASTDKPLAILAPKVGKVLLPVVHFQEMFSPILDQRQALESTRGHVMHLKI